MSSLIIDCDTGRDDALAIWLALNKGMGLVGVVSSYGNTIRDNVSDNCLRVLAFAGRSDIPVLVGASVPGRHHKGLDDVVIPRQAVTGNGMCDLELPVSDVPMPAALSPEDLARGVQALAAKHGKLDYVITGPVTNFAAIAAVLGPALHDVVARVTIWAGKLEGLWASLPSPEFNTICDPFATQALLDSGLPVRLIPMDTTWTMKLDLPELEALKATTKIAQFSKDLMIAHAKNFSPDPLFRFHDPTVIAAFEDEDSFRPARLRVITDESHAEFGRTLEVLDGQLVLLYLPDEDRRDAVLESMLVSLGFAR